METEALSPWVIWLVVLTLPVMVVVMVLLRVSMAVIRTVAKIALLPLIMIAGAILYYNSQAGGTLP